jgi:hypothetical protein
VIVVGLVILAASMGWNTQIPTAIWPNLLRPIDVTLGLAFGFVPVTIAALAHVAPDDAGLASGLISTNQQIGGAIGVALASTIFISTSRSLLQSGHSRRVSRHLGLPDAFWALSGSRSWGPHGVRAPADPRRGGGDGAGGGLQFDAHGAQYDATELVGNAARRLRRMVPPGAAPVVAARVPQPGVRSRTGSRSR